MKAFLYTLGSLAFLAGAITMAFLPRLSPSLLAFIIGGGLLSGIMAGGWTVLTASAGNWPRLHTGPVLILAGFVAVALGLLDRWWPEIAWGVAGLLTGIPLWLARRSRFRDGSQEPAGVRPPLGRREQI